MKKGRPLFIEGRLQTRSWEADGKKNYRTEIVVDNFQFGLAGTPGTGGSREGGAPAGSVQAAEAGMPEMSGMDSGSGSMGGGNGIQYPDDEINPEDIPF